MDSTRQEGEGKHKSEELRYTPCGIPIKPFYRPEDVEYVDYTQDLGDSGTFPYTRGIYPMGYRYFGWQSAPNSGFGLPKETNERQKLLEKLGMSSYAGKKSINVTSDAPGLYGYDPDDPRADGEVGNTGVSISSLRDMEILLNGFALDETNVAFIADYQGPVVLAMYVALADKQGVPRAKLHGQVNNDPGNHFVACQSPQFPPKSAFWLAG